jgi:hypothetical protein
LKGMLVQAKRFLGFIFAGLAFLLRHLLCEIVLQYVWEGPAITSLRRHHLLLRRRRIHPLHRLKMSLAA